MNSGLELKEVMDWCTKNEFERVSFELFVLDETDRSVTEVFIGEPQMHISTIWYSGDSILDCERRNFSSVEELQEIYRGLTNDGPGFTQEKYPVVQHKFPFLIQLSNPIGWYEEN